MGHWVKLAVIDVIAEEDYELHPLTHLSERAPPLIGEENVSFTQSFKAEQKRCRDAAYAAPPTPAKAPVSVEMKLIPKAKEPK